MPGGPVSVVIPTFNRANRLRRVLEGLAAQVGHDELEVIVVSDGSTDGTDELLRDASLPLPVIGVVQANAGPAAARNRGVEIATGDLLLFLDDDVLPSTSLVGTHVAAHGRLGEDAVVIGPMLDPPDHPMSPWVRWEQEMLAKQYAALARGDYEPTARQFYTGNASVRRCHVVDAGGFDTRFRRAEDVELAYRLARRGLRFHFEPAAVGYHYAERSFASWLGNAYEYGRNDVTFSRVPGQQWILGAVAEEFHDRHRWSRALTRACVERPHLRPPAERALRAAVSVTGHRTTAPLARASLSALYGIEYYRGVAEELGGREAFLATVRDARASASAA
jgi:GT2 family glycosyltransferase